jgi:HEAT repeat protein
MKTTRFLVSVLAVILLAAFASAADSNSEPKTAKLIAVLQSDASFFEKARACQQLGEVGTRDGVPALASVLASPELSAYARSGLEGIPDPTAAAALREAASRLKGPLLIGVINSLGALRDKESVDLLRPLAIDPKSGAAKEALLALGNIASPQSIQVIEQALANGTDAVRSEAASACLHAADRLKTAGNAAEARRLFDLVRTAKVAIACRIGATRGAILTRTSDRVPFLIEQLNSDELAIRNAALLTIREIPDGALASSLNAQLTRSRPELQRQLLLAVVDCHNPQTIPVIQILANGANPEIRTTALMVLGQIGPEAAPALLAALQQDQTAEDKAIVLNGLKSLPGSSVDDVLLKALSTASAPSDRIELVCLLGSRGAVKANSEMLKQASGPGKEVNLAALTALQALAGSREVPGLIALIKSSPEEAVRQTAENALTGACGRPGAQPPGAEAVLVELKSATKPAERNCWIRVLAAVGYAEALPLIEAAVGDPDATVAEPALAQLGRWPDPAPMPTLFKVLENGASPSLRKRALVSVIDLATTLTDEGKASEEIITSWMQRANPLTESLAEKRRILGILGHLRTSGSFRLLVSCVDDPNLQAEAAAGIIQIAPALAVGPETSAVKTALDKIAANAGSTELRDRAARTTQAIRAQASAVRLFDGQSLTGWNGDTNVWRVRDEVIVGGSMKGNPQNEFLATSRTYTNFLLRLEYKLVGLDGFINSGVQFRSMRVNNPANEMNGYQADIGAGYSGCLYDESRRNKFLVRADENTVKRIEHAGEWNRYELRCEGRHIQIWLNGEKTVDYQETDETIPQTGLIGLQIHGGSKAEVSFRNITIQEF